MRGKKCNAQYTANETMQKILVNVCFKLSCV